MSGLARLLAGHTDPGVYHWTSAADARTVEHAAEHAGWRFVTLDTWQVEDKSAFLDVCEEAFAFPEWVGHNFDALADALVRCARPGRCRRGRAVGRLGPAGSRQPTSLRRGGRACSAIGSTSSAAGRSPCCSRVQARPTPTSPNSTRTALTALGRDLGLRPTGQCARWVARSVSAEQRLASLPVATGASLRARRAAVVSSRSRSRPRRRHRCRAAHPAPRRSRRRRRLRRPKFLAEHLPLAGVGLAERASDQQRALAFAEVVAARLAGHVALAEDTEHVVTQLERLTQRQAVRREGAQQLLVRVRQRRAELERVARRCTSRTCSGARASRRRRWSCGSSARARRGIARRRLRCGGWSK